MSAYGYKRTSSRLVIYVCFTPESGHNQMIARNTIFEAEPIEQPVLPSQLLAHHDPNPVAESVRAKESRQATNLNRVLQQMV